MLLSEHLTNLCPVICLPELFVVHGEVVRDLKVSAMVFPSAMMVPLQLSPLPPKLWFKSFLASSSLID